jgi:hypothetical protein
MAVIDVAFSGGMASFFRKKIRIRFSVMHGDIHLITIKLRVCAWGHLVAADFPSVIVIP